MFHNNFSGVPSRETHGALSKIKGDRREAKPVLLDQSLLEEYEKNGGQDLRHHHPLRLSPPPL